MGMRRFRGLFWDSPDTKKRCPPFTADNAFFVGWVVGLRPEGGLKLKDKIAATVELSRLTTIGPRCRSYAAAEGQV